MTTTDTLKHPAKFSPRILDAIGTAIIDHTITWPAPARPRVLDPFAGTGARLGNLCSTHGWLFTGVELQPSWVYGHAMVVEGDATSMSQWIEPRQFDVVATSPCYGNRMADHHDAKDGSTRNTYAHVLREQGEEPVGGPTDATQLQWGRQYRKVHQAAWEEVQRVLAPGGLFLLNISNHIRDGREVNVAEWHLHTLLSLGFYVDYVQRIHTRRNRHGANGHPDADGNDPRVDGELLMALYNGTPRAKGPVQ